MRIFLAASACLLLSCGSDKEPIASTPLAGTIGGRAFTAKSARARKLSSNPAKKSISIYDADVTCSSTTPTDRWVVTTPIWKAGAAQDAYSVAWFVAKAPPDGKDTIFIADSSEVEVVEAPTGVGSNGLIRIRATNKGDSIEGQIAVQICE